MLFFISDDIAQSKQGTDEGRSGRKYAPTNEGRAGRKYGVSEHEEADDDEDDDAYDYDDHDDSDEVEGRPKRRRFCSDSDGSADGGSEVMNEKEDEG